MVKMLCLQYLSLANYNIFNSSKSQFMTESFCFIVTQFRDKDNKSSQKKNLSFKLNKGDHTIINGTYFAQQQDWFLQFVLQYFWFDVVQWATIDADQTTSSFAVSNGGCGFLHGKEIIYSTEWFTHIIDNSFCIVQIFWSTFILVSSNIYVKMKERTHCSMQYLLNI